MHMGTRPSWGPDPYTNFTRLKAIHVDVDRGLLPKDEWQAKMADGKADEAEDEAAEREEAKEERVPGQLDMQVPPALLQPSSHLHHFTLKA